MKKYAFLVAILVVVGLLSVFLLNQSKTSNETQPEQSITSQVDNINAQFSNGAIRREEANKQFCNLVVRSENERQKAIKAIRAYTNNPNLKVEYQCNNFSPNNPTAKPTEETYLADGKYYFVEIASNEVIRVQ